MQLPKHAAVMTLENATLFPQALLPFYIFEPRYRQMLAEVLQADRLFAIAMQRPRRLREAPCIVAGLGLIRVSVDHEDGTSHLILQGITRVRLLDVVQLSPYRIHRIEPLSTPPAESHAAPRLDALMTRIHELVRIRLNQGALPFPFPFDTTPPPPPAPPKTQADPDPPMREMVSYLERLRRPEELADLVACALLPRARDRQTILEAVNVTDRLARLVQFLMAEVRRHHKKPSAT